MLACAAVVHAGWPVGTHAQSPNTLPSLGDPVSDDLSIGMERLIGEQIMRVR